MTASARGGVFVCCISSLAPPRPRCYIVGYASSAAASAFKWPEHVAPIPPKSLLESASAKACELKVQGTVAKALSKGFEKIIAKGGDFNDMWFIDVHSSLTFGGGAVKKDVCPCITRSRSASGGYYMTNKKG